MKRYFISLIIKEMEIKTTIKYNYMLVRMTNNNTSVTENVEQLQVSGTAG